MADIMLIGGFILILIFDRKGNADYYVSNPSQ